MPGLYYAGDAGTVPNPRVMILRLDYNSWLLGALRSAVHSLTVPANWVQEGNVTPLEAASIATDIDTSLELAVDMIGMIIPFAGTIFDLPAGMFPCDGRTLVTADYPGLARVMRVSPEDDPTFQIPDLRSMFIVGMNESANWTNNPARQVYTWGTIGGHNNVTLDVDHIPSHSHNSPAHTHIDTGHTHTEITATPTVVTVGAGAPVPSAIPGVGVTGIGAANIASTAVTIENTGGGQAVDIRPPFYAMGWAIIYQWGGR